MKKNKKKGTASKKAKPEAAETPAAESVEDTPEAPPSDDKADEALEESAVKEPEPLLEEPPKDDSGELSPSATPSLAQQSKLRSTSFRAGSTPSGGATSPVPFSPGPFSPDGDTAPEIYRKHVAKIEDLEKENKRLAKEASDSEKRWQKAEEELADIRDADGDDAAAEGGDNGQVDKLVRVRNIPDVP